MEGAGNRGVGLHRATPNSTQGLFLTLDSGFTPGTAQRTTWEATDPTWVAASSCTLINSSAGPRALCGGRSGDAMGVPCKQAQQHQTLRGGMVPTETHPKLDCWHGVEEERGVLPRDPAVACPWAPKDAGSWKWGANITGSDACMIGK